MITLLVQNVSGRVYRVAIPGPEITVGAAPGNTITDVDAALGPHHCTLHVRAAGVFVVDHSGGNTRVNGQPVSAPRPLYQEDKITAGELELLVDSVDLPVDAHQQLLLAAITTGDDDSRAIYADWLEENGDGRRAEFLRLEDLISATMESETPGLDYDTTVRRHAWLTAVLPFAWRARVVRTRIVGCELACLRHWCKLTPMERIDARRCAECHEGFVLVDRAGGLPHMERADPATFSHVESE